MLVKHQSDSQSELSVFIKTPQGQVLSSAKACATKVLQGFWNVVSVNGSSVPH